MTKKIAGGIEVKGNIATVNKKNINRTVNNEQFDSTGNLVLDTYRKDDIREMLSLVPLSHYGEYNDFPPPVAGDYAGCSNLKSGYHRCKCMNVEDDGSLVILNSATNGSTRGIYYTFIPNISENNNLDNILKTTLEYKPSYIPNGMVPIWLIPGDGKVIMGRCGSPTSSEPSITYFISVTGGTFIQDTHVGITFNINELSFTPKYTLCDNTYVYLIGARYNDNTTLSTPIVRLKLNDIINNRLSIEVMNNWSCIDTNKNKINDATNPIISKQLYSTDESNPAFITNTSKCSINPFMDEIDLFAYFINSDEFCISIAGDVYTSSKYKNARDKIAIASIINIKNKSSTVDVPSDYIPTIKIIPLNTDDFTYIRTPNTSSNDMYRSGDNCRMSWLIKNNMVFKIHDNQDASSDPTLTTYKLLSDDMKIYTNVYNSDIKIVKSKALPVSFGTVVTGPIRSYKIIDNKHSLQCSRQYDNGGEWKYTIAENKEFSQIFPYKYNMISSTIPINGVEPTVNRKLLDSNVRDIEIDCLTSYIKDNNATAIGTVLHDQLLSRSLSYKIENDKLIGSDNTLSIDKKVYDNLYDYIINEYNNNHDDKMVKYTHRRGLTFYYLPMIKKSIAILISSAESLSKCLYTIYEIESITNILNNSINIVGYKTITNIYDGEHNSQVQRDNIHIIRNHSHCIFEDGNGFLISISSFYDISVVGYRTSVNLTIAYNKNNTIDKIIKEATDPHDLQTGNPNVMYAYPNIGVGRLLYSQSIFATSLIMNKLGTSYIDYLNNYDKITDYNILINVQTPKGFYVYFTEDVPVLINGKEYILEKTIMSLYDVTETPENKLFYVYVELKEGIANYHIYDIPLENIATTSGYDVLYIGTIKTNNEGIQIIDIKKEYKFDAYYPSYVPKGSSFPVSDGNPSQLNKPRW